MVKHTQTVCQEQPTNCLSVFDHFMGLGLKGLLWETMDQLGKVFIDNFEKL